MENDQLVSNADILFEVSWEVCNKVGGIYTVVKSKIEPSKKHYGDDYFLIGPYFHHRSIHEFEEKVPPDNLRKIFNALSSEGINCHYGTWMTKGYPTVILIDFHDFAVHKDGIKTDLYEQFGVDSLGTEFFDFDQPVIWSWAVGKLLEMVKQSMPDKKIVGHFHEWMSGSAALYLKRHNVAIPTVFTTHATMLGRTLASSNVDIYSSLDKIDPEFESRKYGIVAKWSMERACANNATVFTTVSEITGVEAEKFLGKKPDVYLLNGLDMEKFPSFEEVSIKHKKLKNHLKRFIMHYFFPYHTFDLDNTLFFFTAARYEFHDKGIDMMIDALKKLNDFLKENDSEKNVVAFFFVPANVRNIKAEVIENKTNFLDIKDSIEDESDAISLRLLSNVLLQKDITRDVLFDPELDGDLKKKILRFKKEGNPPICSHDLFDSKNDEIINALNNAGLTNNENDKVRVLFYPIYLTGADGLLDLDYYESMMACHLGIFPSYYEPWGYTPLEAGAIGISSVTTDLAGFGRYIAEKKIIEDQNKGIYVINRSNNNYDGSMEDLFNLLKEFVHLTKYDRIQNKINANKVAHSSDWKSFIYNYIKAHNLALERFGQ